MCETDKKKERERREHIYSSLWGMQLIYLDFSGMRLLFSSCSTLETLENIRCAGYFSKSICQFFSLNNHSAHPRWLPGTPPPPRVPCWTLAPPTVSLIGPLWPLECFHSLEQHVRQKAHGLLFPGKLLL